MRAIFLVKSPLQLLNANEARRHFGYKSEESLLVLLADRKSSPQLVKLIETKNEWINVVNLSDAPIKLQVNDNAVCGSNTGAGFFRNPLFSVFKLSSLARSSSELERVFIGDIGNPLMRHFANSLQDAEAVALDDGTATLTYSQLRIGSGELKKKPSLGKRVKLFFKRKIMGLCDDDLPRIAFFSVYELEVRQPDILIRHDYSHLRNGLCEINQRDDVYFLGSPLVEAGILSEQELYRQLSGVVQYFGSVKVVYVAHRRELPDRVDAIGKLTGWQTCLFDYPIEHQLAKVGPRPKMLASFFSSALDNCQRIFGEELPILSFRLDPAQFARKDSPKGRQVEGLYENYRMLEYDSFKIIQIQLD